MRTIGNYANEGTVKSTVPASQHKRNSEGSMVVNQIDPADSRRLHFPASWPQRPTLSRARVRPELDPPAFFGEMVEPHGSVLAGPVMCHFNHRVLKSGRGTVYRVLGRGTLNDIRLRSNEGELLFRRRGDGGWRGEPKSNVISGKTGAGGAARVSPAILKGAGILLEPEVVSG